MQPENGRPVVHGSRLPGVNQTVSVLEDASIITIISVQGYVL